MHPARVIKQLAALAQRFQNHLVRVFEKQPGVIGEFGFKTPVQIHRMEHRQAFLSPELKIIRPVGRGAMHDAGAIRRTHKIRRHHAKGVCVCANRGPVKQPLVPPPGQLGTALPLLNAISRLTEHIGQPGFGKPKGLSIRRHPHIGLLRVHRQQQIGGQSPWRGGPDQKIPALTLRLKAHNHGRVFYILIAERHFMRRQRRADLRVIRHHLAAAIQQIFVPDAFEQIPDRFDVIVMQREIGIGQIHPIPHAPGQHLPVINIFHHRFTAQAVEFPDADFAFYLPLIK